MKLFTALSCLSSTRKSQFIGMIVLTIFTVTVGCPVGVFGQAPTLPDNSDDRFWPVGDRGLVSDPGTFTGQDGQATDADPIISYYKKLLNPAPTKVKPGDAPETPLTCGCPGNLVQNPSFESGTAGWSSSGGGFSVGSGFQQCGNNNGFLDASGGNAQWLWQSFTGIAVGSNVTMSAFGGTHQPQYDHQFRIAFYNSGGTYISSVSQQVDYDVDGQNGNLQLYTLNATVPANTYYVRVEGYASNDFLKIDQVCLTVETCTGAITGLVFNEMSGGSDITITNGGTYLLDDVVDNFNLEASTSGGVSSVVFTITGASSGTATENLAPWNYPGSGTTWTPVAGTYTVTIKAYSQDNGTGALCAQQTFTFTLQACNNATNGGTIGSSQSGCGSSFDPAAFTNITSPSGGSGTLETIWIKSTTNCPPASFDGTQWTTIAGATGLTYDPGTITQTTCYRRCSRRAGCSTYAAESNIITVTLSPSMSVSISGGNNSLCTGGTTTLKATASGGTTPYTYAWSNGAGSRQIVGVTPAGTTTYTVTVTSASGCTATAQYTVNTSSCPTCTTRTASNALECSNGTNYGFYSNGLYSGGTYYSLSNGSFKEYTDGTASLTGTLTNTNGAQFLLDVVFSGRTTTTPPSSPKPTTCGNYVLNAADFYYYTSYDGTLVGLGNLAGGIVTFSEMGPAFQVGTGANVEQNVFGASGWLTLSVQQQPTNTAYVLNSASGDINLNLTGGSCTACVSTTITAAITGTNTICQGSSTTLTASGGNSYLWSTGATTSSITVSPVNTTTYTVTVTAAGGCTATATRTVTVSTPMTLSTSVTNILCNGGAATGAIDLTVNGGTSPYTYNWGAGQPTTQDRTNLAIGTYTVTVTDAFGCTKTTSATITQPTVLTLSTTQVNVACNNSSTGSIDLTVSGGTGAYTYAWTGGVTTQDRTGLVAGTYTVTVTDANGCTKSTSATITQSGVLTLVCEAQVNGIWTVLPTCQLSVCVGSVLALSVNPNVNTVNWSGPNGYTATGVNDAFVSNAVTAAQAGNYTATLTDANGCVATTTITVTVNTPTASITGANTICAGSSTTFTASGGGTYAWSTGASTAAITVSTAGTYTVTVTSSGGCTATASRTLTVPPALVLSTTPTPVLCNGGATGSIDLTVTGGVSPYTYAWSNSTTAMDPTGLVAGTYTVTVTDANACTKSTSATVTQPTALVLSVTATNVTLCSIPNGALDLTVSGGTSPYTYDWSNNGAQNPDTDPQDLTGLGVGNYTVTVTDANGCTATTSKSITGPLSPTLSTTTTPVLCNGASTGAIDLTVTGGTGVYTYDWSNDGPDVIDDDPQDLSNVPAGTYTVTVTDAAVCTAVTSATITQPATAITLSTTQVNVLCNGASTGSINLTVTGGTGTYTYSWMGGVTTQNRTGLAAGTYAVTVTDANGCTKTTSTTITQPTVLALSTTQVNVLCNGASTGSINLTVTGGTGTYTYSWTGGVTTQKSHGSGRWHLCSDRDRCQWPVPKRLRRRSPNRQRSR